MSDSLARNSRLVNNTSTMPVQLTKLVMSASVTLRPIVLNCRPSGFVGEEIGGKRVLRADGFSYPIGAHRPLVDAARSPVIIGARFPELLLQEGQSLCPEIEPGLDPQPPHLSGCRRPDAVKLPDRQGLDEYRPHFRSDDEEPIRL